MTIITIVALLVLAVALVLRDIMAEIDRMRQRSSTDAMTGLLNRATFEEAASTQLRTAGIWSTPMPPRSMKTPLALHARAAVTAVVGL